MNQDLVLSTMASTIITIRDSIEVFTFKQPKVMDQEWYQNFVSDENLGGSNDMLFDLLTAANFMGIKELLDLSCLKVTFQLTGKWADEIREILRLPELTPEEEQQARMEHKWIFEDS